MRKKKFEDDVDIKILKELGKINSFDKMDEKMNDVSGNMVKKNE